MSEPWTPRIIQGGKVDAEDWLWDLEIGEVFLSTGKVSHLLDLWQVVFKRQDGPNRAVRLEHPEMVNCSCFVDSKLFSSKFTLFMVLPGVSNGTTDRMEQE